MQFTVALNPRKKEKTPSHMFAVTKKVAPKVIKYATPWYIRWIYSICGEEVHKMATSTVAPAENANTIGNASDSVVGVFF